MQETTRFHWPVNPAKRLINRVWYAVFSVIYILATWAAPIITAICLSGVIYAANYQFYLTMIVGLGVAAIALKVLELYLNKLDTHYKRYRVFLQIYKTILAIIMPAIVIIICLMLNNCVQIATDRLLLIIEISCGCIAFGGIIKCIFIDELKEFFSALNLSDKLDQSAYLHDRVKH